MAVLRFIAALFGALLVVGAPSGALAAGAGDGHAPKVAVFPFVATGVDSAKVDALTEIFADEGRKSPGYDIVSARDVDTLLGVEQRKQMLGCSDDSCVAEIAGALGAESVVLGSISKFGQSYVVSIRRVGARSARAVAQFSETVRSTPSMVEEALLDAVRRAARQLLPARVDLNAGVDTAGEPAEADLTAQVESPDHTWPWIRTVTGVLLMGGGGVAHVLNAGMTSGDGTPTAAGAVAGYALGGTLLIWGIAGLASD